MATLAEAVDAGETDWIISAGITADFLTVESETVAVLTHFPVQLDPQTRLPLPPRIRVQRGAGGTTAASHADGTTLTPLIPPASSGGGGGAFVVTDGVTTVPDVITLHALAVTEAAPGEAEITTFPGGWFFDTGDSDFLTNPGAGILVGDLTEDGPYTRIEANRIKVSGNDLTVEDGTDGMPILWADTVEGVAAFENVGGDFRFRVLRSGAVLLPGLPTANPNVADQLWNDAGVLKVSAG